MRRRATWAAAAIVIIALTLLAFLSDFSVSRVADGTTEREADAPATARPNDSSPPPTRSDDGEPTARRRTAKSAGPTGRLNVFVHCDQIAVSDAKVRAWAIDRDDVESFTNAEGRAALDLPEGDWTLTIAAESFGGAFAPDVHIIAGPDATDLELELERKVPVEGVVVDEGGAALADASVNYAERTDSNGAFRITLTNARPLIVAEYPGFVPARLFFSDGSFADAGPFRLVLRRDPSALKGFAVRGVVLGEDGQPVKGASIHCSADTEVGTLWRDADSDAAGRFEVACAAPAGELSVWSLEGNRNDIAVKEGDDVTIRLPGRRSVKGRAIDTTGAPVTSVRVSWDKYSSRDFITTDGVFEVQLLDPEELTLEFTSPRLTAKVIRKVNLVRGNVDVGDVVFPQGAKLRGMVVDQSSGLPITGASVKGNGVDVKTNTLGVFEISIDPTQRLELDVSRPGFIARWVPLDPRQRDVRITLTPIGDAGQSREFGGIGASTAPLRDGGAGFELLRVSDGLPASEAGLRAGDEVVAIDGQPAVGSMEEVLTRIRGPVDTVVLLTIRREGRVFEVRVTRKLIRY